MVSGNIVSVRCTGNKIGLRIAQPDFGWRVHVETNDGRIYVTFRTGEEEDQRQAQVIAMCREGTPELAVNNR